MSRTRRPGSQQRTTSGRNSGLVRNPTAIAVAGGGIIAVILAAVFLFNRGDGENPDDETPSTAGSGLNDSAKKSSKVVTPPKIETGVCRLHTKVPGFFVFVDGEPVRDADENWVTTPCAVTVPRGIHDFTVAKSGFEDTQRSANIEAELTIDFGEIAKANPSSVTILDAAYLKSPTAQPIPLFSLNTGGKSYDPSITPDGRTLYFVSDRGGTKRIFHVTRKSAYDFFSEKPQPIETTRGADLPASPVLSADQLAIVYCLPALGNIYAVTRDLAVAEFRARKLLLRRMAASAKWESVQAIREPGKSWRLYLLQNDGKKRKGYTAVARKLSESGRGFGGEANADGKALAPLSEQEFESPVPFDLNGQPPCLSQDGLRSYQFHGRELRRAVRRSLDEPFPAAEIIANLEIPDYESSAVRRSFSLTDDEQWLFYESRGQLAMVRVFPGRSWGFVARGKSIPPLAPKVVVIPEKKKPPVVPKPKKPKVDPRTLPLPYPVLREKLLALLKTRKYEAARKLLAAAISDPQLKNDLQLLKWDSEETKHLIEFWADMHTAASKMKPGMAFFVGPARVSFVKYENGTITAKSGTATFTTKTSELSAADAVALIEKLLDRDDPKIQMRAGCLLFHDGKGNTKSAMTRFQHAGDAGTAFLERLAQRSLLQARHEFDRDNVAQGLELVNELLKAHAKSKAAESAKSLIEEAYRRTKWTTVGSRKWTRKDDVWTAAAGRSPGSLLRSPKQVGNCELRLEWKSDVPNGQGGVYFRYTGSGDLGQTAFKIPLSDDFGIRPDPLCTGALYKLQAPTENAVKQRGQWNSLIVRVNGERVQAVVNGRQVLDTIAKNENIPLKGYIALDGAFGGISYRKMLLVETPARP